MSGPRDMTPGRDVVTMTIHKAVQLSPSRASPRSGATVRLKTQLQYISKIWFSTRIENQNPETRKVTLDYKFDLPVVEFGIKFHGSDDKCQIRGSERSRTIELDACGGWTTTGALYAARFWTRWPPVPLQFPMWPNITVPTERSQPCLHSIKSGFSWFYTASGP